MLQGPDGGPIADVPDFYLTIERSASYLTVSREDYGGHVLLMGLDCRNLGCCLDAPDFDLAIIGATGQLPVWQLGKRCHGRLVSSQICFEFTARRIPHLDGVVEACADEIAACEDNE